MALDYNVPLMLESAGCAKNTQYWCWISISLQVIVLTCWKVHSRSSWVLTRSAFLQRNFMWWGLHRLQSKTAIRQEVNCLVYSMSDCVGSHLKDLERKSRSPVCVFQVFKPFVRTNTYECLVFKSLSGSQDEQYTGGGVVSPVVTHILSHSTPKAGLIVVKHGKELLSTVLHISLLRHRFSFPWKSILYTHTIYNLPGLIGQAIQKWRWWFYLPGP